MLTLIAFIITIGILVTVHEYGHFQVAKWCGVKVLKFSVGFGKPIWSKKVGPDQTEFIIAAIPLGGYVKMHGEGLAVNENGYDEEASRAFNRQSVHKRMAIVLAGPLANLLLAIALYFVLFMTGTVGLKPMVGQSVPNSSAAASGINAGATIIKVNGKAVTTWQEVRWSLLNSSLKNNKVTLQAINQRGELSVHQLNLADVNRQNPDVDILTKLGLSVFQPSVPARIGEVIDNGPADIAGLKLDDLVLTVNQTKIADWEAFVATIKSHPGQTLQVEVMRGDEKIKLAITPELVKESGESYGRIGAGFAMAQAELDKFLVTQHYGPIDAFNKSLEKTWDTAVFSLKMLGNMLMGNVSWKGMSGPVTIANYAGQSANMGLKVFIGFLALVSISIGVLNLLPIPILDGGHLMYYMFEFFTGKPASEFAIVWGQKIGFFILILTMTLALYNDLNRLITG